VNEDLGFPSAKAQKNVCGATSPPGWSLKTAGSQANLLIFGKLSFYNAQKTSPRRIVMGRLALDAQAAFGQAVFKKDQFSQPIGKFRSVDACRDGPGY
jgi:hypothetical protein